MIISRFSILPPALAIGSMGIAGFMLTAENVAADTTCSASAEARFIESGEDEYIYARYGNPTVRMFEDRIAAIEGTEDAFATASGMAAVSGALTSMLKAGDHVVSAKALFGSCLYILEEILTRFGVDVTFVDGTDLDAWKAAVRDDTKAVFLESVSNPTLEVIDLKGVAEIAHAKGATVVVDNVFATPAFSKAAELGADVIVYSATKHIDGQGRCLGGVICGTKEFIRKTAEPYLKHTGGSLSPFNAWVMLKGLETMHLRCAAQAESALFIAEALEGHTKLDRTLYPYLDSHPQQAVAKEQMGAGGPNNLGARKSISTHRAATTHQRLSVEQRAELGITDGLIRMSVGLEDKADLLDDIRTALDAV